MHAVLDALSRPGSSRFGVAVGVLYYVGVRLFVLALVFFMLAIWVLVQREDASSWITWISWKAALIPSAIVVGTVQIAALLFCVARTSHVLNPHVRGMGLQWCWSIISANFWRDFGRLIFFEWVVFNLVSFFVAISSLGLPNVHWANDVIFAVTAFSSFLQYFIYVRWYLRKRFSLDTWHLRQTFFLLGPLIAVLLFSAVILFINFVLYPHRIAIRIWWGIVVGLLLASIIVLPLVLHYLLFRPLQRRLERTRLQAAVSQYQGMEAAIVRKCKQTKTEIESLRSVVLIGGGYDEIAGLERAAKLQRLYLSCNRISSCRGLEGLESLESLHMQDNLIATWHALVPLRDLPALTKLQIERNPILHSAHYSLERLVTLIPHLHKVNGIPITAEFKSRAITSHTNWLSFILASYEKDSFYDRLNSPLGSALHLYIFHYSLRSPLDPLFKRGELLRHSPANVSDFYKSLASLQSDATMPDSESNSENPLPFGWLNQFSWGGSHAYKKRRRANSDSLGRLLDGMSESTLDLEIGRLSQASSAGLLPGFVGNDDHVG